MLVKSYYIGLLLVTKLSLFLDNNWTTTVYVEEKVLQERIDKRLLTKFTVMISIKDTANSGCKCISVFIIIFISRNSFSRTAKTDYA